MTKLEQLIAEVRRLAAEAPEAVYRKPSSITSYCFYTQGNTSNGGCGCIFGQALKNVLPEVWESLEVFERENEAPYGSVPVVIGDYGLRDLTKDVAVQRQVNWCSRVQRFQDGGTCAMEPPMSWGRAVEQADEEFEVSKNPL